MKNDYEEDLRGIIGALMFLSALFWFNSHYDMVYRYSDIIESRLQFKIAKAKIKSIEKIAAGEGSYTLIAYSFSVEGDTINRNDQHYSLTFTSDDYVRDKSIVIYYENKIKSSRLLLIEDFIGFFIFSIFMPFVFLYNIISIGTRLFYNLIIDSSRTHR